MRHGGQQQLANLQGVESLMWCSGGGFWPGASLESQLLPPLELLWRRYG